ncbi:hypothetical protein CSX04_04938 [Burkholderia cepacia]|nr:hypothetical protein CSX04_04938 [Burkholderia cepacia]
MRLHVYVKGKLVAHLYRQADDYALRYTADALDADFASLTMPVREDAWVWPRDLHPFFRQNLPEGFLFQVIREEFGPYLDGTDLSLLAIIGGSGIGRVTVTPEGGPPGGELDPLDLKSLLHEDITTARFAELVRYYARAAISGAVPKFLAPELRSGQAPVGKQTLRTSRHIVKGSDEQTPYLGFNEHYSMQVLARLGVARVAKTTMSDDGRVLVVDRFDIDEQGKPALGLEDACSLLGLPPHEKYRPSTEQVLNATKPYIGPANWRREAEQLGWQLITNYVVRNADCHAKNIALIYSNIDDVIYTPAYDIVTTEAYPRFANNPPGLSIEGRKNVGSGENAGALFQHAPRHPAKAIPRNGRSAVRLRRIDRERYRRSSKKRDAVAVDRQTDAACMERRDGIASQHQTAGRTQSAHANHRGRRFLGCRQGRQHERGHWSLGIAGQSRQGQLTPAQFSPPTHVRVALTPPAAP